MSTKIKTANPFLFFSPLQLATKCLWPLAREPWMSLAPMGHRQARDRQFSLHILVNSETVCCCPGQLNIPNFRNNFWWKFRESAPSSHFPWFLGMNSHFAAQLDKNCVAVTDPLFPSTWYKISSDLQHSLSCDLIYFKKCYWVA